MTQVYDIVRGSLLALRVIDAEVAVPAQDMTDGIAALNRMMRRWEADGIALGWNDVVGPTDDVPLPPEAEEAVIYNLAVRRRSDYGVSIEPDVLQLATDGLARLTADVRGNEFVTTCYGDLPYGTGQSQGWGWREGYFS
ncbi:packaged DNA stabilization gp4 family protein [Lysobacter soli]|uniref:packaged DNA stabilization gp4 family protein n=1 Tax=Lysobacter soli TaxID=453783 RepID=UPI0037C852E2